MSSTKEFSDMTKEELIEYIGLLEADIENEKNARAQDKLDYDSLADEYEKEIEEKTKELLKARGKIISQDITLASFKDKVGIPIIVEGTEHDLYKGEQKDFVLSLIASAMGNYEKYTRSYRICESLLSANKAVGKRMSIQDSISKILKNYNGMTKDIISSLKEIGIDIVEDGSHVKLVFYGDNRYTITISTTPSDPRCGLNAITDIGRMLF